MNENKPLFCSNCGKKIQGHGKFCSFCGAEIPQIDGTDIEMQLSGNDSKAVMEPMHTSQSGQNEKHSSFETLNHGLKIEITPEKNNGSSLSVITAIAVSVLALACVVCFMILPQYRMNASIALILVGAAGFYIAYHIGKKDFTEQSEVYAAGVDLGVSSNEELYQIIQGMHSETVLKIWIDGDNVKIQGKRGVHDFYVDNNLVKIRVPLALLNVYRSVLRSIKQMRIHGQSRKLAEANSIMDEMIRWSGRKVPQHEVSYDTAGRGGKVLFPSFPSIIIGGVLDHADKFYVDMAYSKFHQMYGFHEDTGYEEEKADQIKACWEQGDFWGLYDEYKEELEEYLESENGDVAAQYLERVNMDMDRWFSDFDSVGDSISKITDVYY